MPPGDHQRSGRDRTACYCTLKYDFLNSSGIDPASKFAHFTCLLRELPAGLNEWAVHPGFDNLELMALETILCGVRQTDYGFFGAPIAKALIAAEGITLLDTWHSRHSGHDPGVR